MPGLDPLKPGNPVGQGTLMGKAHGMLSAYRAMPSIGVLLLLKTLNIKRTTSVVRNAADQI